MLGKLERKFVLTNMLLVGVVILVVLVYICINSYTSKISSVDRVLKETLMAKDSNNKVTREIGNGAEPRDNRDDYFKSIEVLTVLVGNDGQYKDINTDYATMSDENLDEAVKAVMDSEDEHGILWGQNLFFVKRASKDGTKIAFGEYSSAIDINDTIRMAIQVGAIAMMAFFLISLLLAKMAFMPVQEAWDQQQQFVADASHELKTPLTVILANHNILQSHPYETIISQEKWIDSTYEETVHMKKLVDDLLFLARSDAKRIETVLADINLSEMAISIILQFEPVAFEKNINIDYNVTPDIMVKGDVTQLKQLVHILLDNALKYASKNGQVFLRLLIHQNFAILSVSNTGKAISQEDMVHLFERFYRSDKARSREGGYGLGLSIAKSITDTHKGNIAVSSDEYYGTTFTVKIPCVSGNTKRIAKNKKVK